MDPVKASMNFYVSSFLYLVGVFFWDTFRQPRALTFEIQLKRPAAVASDKKQRRTGQTTMHKQRRAENPGGDRAKSGKAEATRTAETSMRDSLADIYV